MAKTKLHLIPKKFKLDVNLGLPLKIECLKTKNYYLNENSYLVILIFSCLI